MAVRVGHCQRMGAATVRPSVTRLTWGFGLGSALLPVAWSAESERRQESRWLGAIPSVVRLLIGHGQELLFPAVYPTPIAIDAPNRAARRSLSCRFRHDRLQAIADWDGATMRSPETADCDIWRRNLLSVRELETGLAHAVLCLLLRVTLVNELFNQSLAREGGEFKVLFGGLGSLFIPVNRHTVDRPRCIFG